MKLHRLARRTSRWRRPKNRPTGATVFFATAMIIATLFAGCIRRPPPQASSDDSAIAKATALMDTGNYEDAVKTLNELLASAPDDNRARLLLSNAYVRWSGIKFSDFIPLARFYLNQSEKKNPVNAGSDALLKALRHSRNFSENPMSNAIETFERALLSLEAYSVAYNLIPEIDESSYLYFNEGLNQAIQADSSKKGDILYRVVLRVVKLKYLWTHGPLLKFMDEKCQLVPTRFTTFFDKTRAEYLVISGELTRVYPKMADDLANNLYHFDNVTAQVEKKIETAFGSHTETNSSPDNHKSIWQCL